MVPVLAHGAADSLVFGVAGLVGVSAALLSRHRMGPARSGRLLLAVAAAGIGFQTFHATEHIAQAGSWLAHPTALPWLSPLAQSGVDVLAGLTDGRPGTGAELLHLLGNLIYLAGLAAALRLAVTQHRPRRLLRVALWVQAAHVVEHALLTTTWLTVGRPLGVSTAFGALAVNPTIAVATRVWVHLAINLVGIALALLGVRQTWMARVPEQPTIGTSDQRAGGGGMSAALSATGAR